MNRSSVASLAIAAAIPACSLATIAPDDIEESRDEIRGGQAESGMPAVGLVTFGTSYCTGTLIAPNVVLTAAHCIPDEGAIHFSGRVVAERLAYPSYYPWASCPNTTRDIGLLRLAAPITDIAPIPYGAAPEKEETCIVVGFGRHEGVERTKRSGTSRIVDVTGHAVKVTWGDALAVSGDSGGPLLCHGNIVATAACHNDGEGASHQHEYYQRLDQPTAWLDATITRWSAP